MKSRLMLRGVLRYRRRIPLRSSAAWDDMASILILDDNRDLAEATAQLLAAFGHEVDVAMDCDEAMREVARLAPDAVIVDIGLPATDGFEVARRLRARYGSRLRLVAHTAWSDDATRRKAVDAGFDDMLVKPASIAQFLTALADNDAGANAGSGAAAQHYRFGSSGPLR